MKLYEKVYFWLDFNTYFNITSLLGLVECESMFFQALTDTLFAALETRLSRLALPLHLNTGTETAAVDLQNPYMPGNEVTFFLAHWGNLVGLKGK